MRNGAPVAYQTFELPVVGGTLHAAVWGSSGPVVLCVHGFSGNHLQFQALADQLGHEARLVTLDLRGRAHSANVSGPFGMAVHAADVIALLDHLAIPKANLVLGHSMGGFVAAVLAARYPSRVDRVLMVDGGILLLDVSFIRYLPFSAWIVRMIAKAVVGPSLERLDQAFASREAFLEHWRQHPALAGRYWSKYAETFVTHDLGGSPPNLRPMTRKESLLQEGHAQLTDGVVPDSLRKIRCPVRFLRAPRGVRDGAPVYPEKPLARAASKIHGCSTRTIADVNHFTVLVSGRGAGLVAEEIRAMLGSGPGP